MKRCRRAVLVAATLAVLAACAGGPAGVRIAGTGGAGEPSERRVGGKPGAASLTSVSYDDRAWDAGRHGGSLTVPPVIGRANASLEPTSLNPAMAAWNEAETTILNMLFVAPIERDPLTGEWAPKLAERFDLLGGGKRVRITLRGGLSWSDGTPLTVDDIIFSYDRLYGNPDAETVVHGYLEAVEGVEARKIDERTYELEFGSRHMSAWELVTLPPLPRHVVEPWLEEHGMDAFIDFWSVFDSFERHVSNGPFRLAEYVPRDRVRLERNPHYFELDELGRPLPYLDELLFLIRPDADQLELYRDGEIDLVRVSEPDDRGRPPELGDGDPAHLFVTTVPWTLHLLFVNQSRPNEENPYGIEPPQVDWLRDLRFRTALAHLVDRGRLTEEAFGEIGVPMWFGEPPHSPYAMDGRDNVPAYDPTTAGAILDELGMIDHDGDGVREDGDGNPVVLEIVTNAESTERAEVARSLSDELARVGIRLEVVIEPFGEVVLRLLETGGWEIVLLGYRAEPGLAPWIFDQPFSLTRTNDERTMPFMKTVRELDARLERTVDDDELAAIFQEAQALLDRQLDMIWLHSAGARFAARRPLGNLEPRLFDGQMFSYERIFLRQP
jgi:peptide/nickel transport system substrate-binding protein